MLPPPLLTLTTEAPDNTVSIAVGRLGCNIGLPQMTAVMAESKQQQPLASVGATGLVQLVSEDIVVVFQLRSRSG